MAKYSITVSRDGKFWHVDIPEISGATQAVRLSEVNDMAIDYIAIVTGEDPRTIALERSIILPKSVRKHLDAAAKLRAQETAARAQAASESRKAAIELVESGLTLRDAGEALGVSHQRVQQLVSSDDLVSFTG